MKLQPPAVLLQGPSGSGKTYSLPTFIGAGIETFVLCTEPGGPESLLDSVRDNKLDVNKLHWATALPTAAGWEGMKSMAEKIGINTFEGITKLSSGIGKEQTRHAAMKLLNNLTDFQCERTGKNFGDVTTWDSSRAFVLDSLSGLSLISWYLTVGHRPTAAQGEWSIAMNFIRDLVLKLTSDRSCYFVLTAHIEKELNELKGTQEIMTSTLGRKLAPQLPRFFSEVVLAQRKLDQTTKKFWWATIDFNAELKNRSLPVSNDLTPSFVQLVESYKKRLELAASTSQGVAA